MHLQYSGAPEPKAGQPLIIGRLGKTCIMIRREQRIPGETLRLLVVVAVVVVVRL